MVENKEMTSWKLSSLLSNQINQPHYRGDRVGNDLQNIKGIKHD
jgi:hypothetical protein